jgi:flagellar hook assembly protein FlgD
MTQQVYPYVLKINVYNEAGEIVKTIASVPTNNLMTSASLTFNGVETGNMLAGEGAFSIYIPGVETPYTCGTGSTGFVWEGENDQSQAIGPGAYYLKIEQTDPYGHVYSITKDINIIDGREYVELNIYNASGELIKKQRQYGGDYSGFGLSIDVPDLISIKPGGANNIDIKYSNNSGDVLTWDGKTADGIVVSNGSYEIQVVVKDDIRGTVSTSKTIIVLRESEQYLGNISIVPNPYTKKDEALGGVEIRWDSNAPAWQLNYPLAAAGTVRIMILNLNGELVRVLAGNLKTGMVKWDTKTARGGNAAGGTYIVIVEGLSDSGYRERKIQKLAIVRGNY